MAGWEYILLGFVCLVAWTSLARLMRAKRARMIAELTQQAKQQSRLRRKAESPSDSPSA